MVEDILADPFLHSVLRAARESRQQCLTLLELMAVQTATATATATPSEECQLQLAREQKFLLSRLAELRGLNRRAVLAVRQTKQSTAEARSEMDRLHLQLQNLSYERGHLQGEIAACESYE